MSRSETAISFPGMTRWFDHVLVPLRNPDGSVRAVLGVSRDVTERKRSEETLKSSEERYRRLIEHSFDAVVVHKNGIITLANQAAVSLAGASSPSELIGKNILEFIHPDFRDLVRERMAAMTSRDEMTAVDAAEEKFLRVDGKAIDVEVVATGFIDAGQRAIQSIFRDITGRKELMETLRMSEEKYRTLVEHNQSGVFIIQGRQIRYVNSALARILGGVPEDFIMHDFGEFIAPEDRDLVLERGLSRQRGEAVPENYECWLLRRDGTTRVFVSLDAGLIQYQGNPASMGTIRDITEQKRAAEALMESGEILRAVFDSTFQFTGMMTPEGILLDANRTALEFVSASSGRYPQPPLRGRLLVAGYMQRGCTSCGKPSLSSHREFCQVRGRTAGSRQHHHTGRLLHQTGIRLQTVKSSCSSLKPAILPNANMPRRRSGRARTGSGDIRGWSARHGDRGQ